MGLATIIYGLASLVVTVVFPPAFPMAIPATIFNALFSLFFLSIGAFLVAWALVGARPSEDEAQLGKALVQSRIAFHLSLWPLVVFLSLLGASFLLFLAVRLNEGPFKEVVGPFVIFLIFQVINNPLLGFLLLFSLFGIMMGIGIRAWRVDERTSRIAAKAALLGFAGFAAYALLVWFWSGFGR